MLPSRSDLGAKDFTFQNNPARLSAIARFFGFFLFDCMDAGDRAKHGVIAEAAQNKETALSEIQRVSNKRTRTLLKVNPFVLSLSKDERIYFEQGG